MAKNHKYNFDNDKYSIMNDIANSIDKPVYDNIETGKYDSRNNDIIDKGEWLRREREGKAAALYGVKSSESTLGTYNTREAANVAAIDDLSDKGRRVDTSLGSDPHTVDKRRCFLAHEAKAEGDVYYLCVSDSADVRADIPIQKRIMNVVSKDGALFASKEGRDRSTTLEPIVCDVLLEQEIQRAPSYENVKTKERGYEFDPGDPGSGGSSYSYNNDEYENQLDRRRRMVPGLEPREREFPDIERPGDDGYEFC